MEDFMQEINDRHETIRRKEGINNEGLKDFLTDTKRNVNDTERIVSAVAGSGLITYGVSKRGFMGAVLSLVGTGLLYRGATGHCHLYSAVDKTSVGDKANTRVHVQKSVTINKSQAELYSFWRNFENLPQFMNHLESVQVLDDQRSRWKAKAPLGTTVEWEAILSSDVPNERIGWASIEGSEVPNSGVVEFRPTANRGTEVRVTLTYEPPAGTIGSWIAWAFGEEPNQQVWEDLRRFKALMEAGSIMRVDGQTSGRTAEVAEEKAKTKTASA
jgi:uncharacterized membrane protein